MEKSIDCSYLISYDLLVFTWIFFGRGFLVLRKLPVVSCMLPSDMDIAQYFSSCCITSYLEWCRVVEKEPVTNPYKKVCLGWKATPRTTPFVLYVSLFYPKSSTWSPDKCPGLDGKDDGLQEIYNTIEKKYQAWVYLTEPVANLAPQLTKWPSKTTVAWISFDCFESFSPLNNWGES